MPAAELPLIDDIRAASRQMVRELGFMEQTLAATDYPPSAVHTILEVGARGPMTSVQLAEILHLEKSSVSRMVRKLVACGELKETVRRGRCADQAAVTDAERTALAGRPSRFRPAASVQRALAADRGRTEDRARRTCDLRGSAEGEPRCRG